MPSSRKWPLATHVPCESLSALRKRGRPGLQDRTTVSPRTHRDETQRGQAFRGFWRPGGPRGCPRRSPASGRVGRSGRSGTEVLADSEREVIVRTPHGTRGARARVRPPRLAPADSGDRARRSVVAPPFRAGRRRQAPVLALPEAPPPEAIAISRDARRLRAPAGRLALRAAVPPGGPVRGSEIASAPLRTIPPVVSSDNIT
jgi:hypothetical protein